MREVVTLGRRADERPFDDTWTVAQGGSAVSVPGQDGQTLVKARNRFHESQMVTVASSWALADGDLSGPITTRPFLLVRFGAGGVLQEAFVDLAAGTAFSVMCDSIEVVLVYPAGAGPAVRASAQIGTGTRPGVGQNAPAVNFTDGPFVLDPAAGFTAIIPPFARSVTLLLSDPSALQGGGLTRISVETWNDLAGTVKAGSLLVPGAYLNYPQSFPIFGWGRAIRVSCAGAAAAQPCFLLYELAL